LRILFLAKRRYTNKDALTERFGRVYQLPLNWAGSGHQVQLALLDYRSLAKASSREQGFPAISLPVLDPRSLRELHAVTADFQPDVIVASGDCFIGLAGLHLARRASARFVFDVYDDYSSFGSYRVFLGWNAMGFLMERADLVLYASRLLASRHSRRSRWTLAPNGVDPAVFHPGPMADARSSSGLHGAGQKLVGYFGSMEADRGVDDLIAATGRLHASDPEVRLLLCGTLRAGMQPLPPWVEYRGVVSHSAIPDYLNACNVVALPYRRSQVMDMGASCKIAEYLLCERPLVATDTPNFVGNFPRQAAEIGPALCKAGDPADLARALSYQFDHGVVASPPIELTWQAVAKSVVAELEPDEVSGQRSLQ
jgi:glycosyltransferase involved in cell wall biosynthesis